MKKLLITLLAAGLILASCGANGTTVDETPDDDTVIEDVNGEVEGEVDAELPEEDAELPEDVELPPHPVYEGETSLDMALEEMMLAVLSGVQVPGANMTTPLEPDNEMWQWLLFSDYIEGAEAVVNESMIGSFAYSVALVRLPEGTDADAFAQAMEENADPAKWICVCADNVDTVVRDNVVLFYMVDTAAWPTTVDGIVENFNNI